ncbi:IS1634 family transposase [Methanocella arvoryzae]|uniref:Transposase (IS4) n=1 Tax=Methanocella arvoryzae (strain DSM 22066 / NBRC 105507 / MRE50) TaxID=351160 RepID=Q0W147_METAR|nr:IS1634 family transposase [Methanocella arvoryzae]CAJ35805.1 transposase (IS4) [Methanocella arvoryzae MRE50]CAJ37896.1 transposase (IS4) [Methanocella arvoryzae MRE50]
MKNVDTRMLDHLGLVAGCYDEYGVAGIIDEVLPKKRVHRIGHGVTVKAMILNGLGFVDRPLYMTPEFFSKVPCERLLGGGVSPEYLNDDALGKTLDCISEYGPTELFNEIILNGVMKKLGLRTHLLHLDTTSFSLYGEYPEEGEADIKINLGLPKDGRWDLKRFVVGLACNHHGMPLFMKAFSGNHSDRKSLMEMVESLKRGLSSKDKVYHVADSAFYTKENLQGVGVSTFWISRVPNTIKEAAQLLGSDVELKPCKDQRYSYYETLSDYAGVPQKWILVNSKEMQKTMTGTFERKLSVELDATEKSFVHLRNQEFFCGEDALKAAHKWILDHPLVKFEAVSTEAFRKKNGRGRPRKNEPVQEFYRIKATIKTNQEEVTRRRERLGRFIIATNDVERDGESLLTDYKDQGIVERGFRFLKDDTFRVSNVYLKKPERIEALAMIMVLCLLIYSILEWKLREKLKSSGKTVRSQTKKRIQNPTMKWVFYLFLGVAEVHVNIENHSLTEITHITDDLRTILDLLGEPYKKYYD